MDGALVCELLLLVNGTAVLLLRACLFEVVAKRRVMGSPENQGHPFENV